ncbi:MAG: hypothetical protein JWM33_2392 [Caulobacteraceae bacterium]|nr:hypothetical protein [Caulobacteraceae bacterium]
MAKAACRAIRALHPGAMAPRQHCRSSSEDNGASATKRRRRRADSPIKVTDDWPDFVPVTDHEARIIEAFFADVLDELFGPLP